MYEGSGVLTAEQNNTSQVDEKVVASGEVTPKVRFIGNPTNELIIIPDLKNEVDEEGLTINPGDKIDLSLYYKPQEINRSRGLDKMLKGVFERPSGKQTAPPKLIVLESLDQEMPPIPEAFDKQHPAGSTFEAGRNFADDNLAKLDEQEKKEEEKIRSKNKHV